MSYLACTKAYGGNSALATWTGVAIYRRKFKALKFTVLFWRVSKLSCKRTNIISINDVYGNNRYLLSEPYEMRKHIMWFHTPGECSVRLVTRGFWTDKLWSVMYSHRWKCCCHDNKISSDLRYTIRGTVNSASIRHCCLPNASFVSSIKYGATLKDTKRNKLRARVNVWCLAQGRRFVLHWKARI